MRLALAVQHHPGRAELLPRLLAELGDAEVVTDPEPGGTPSPWRTYRLALETMPAGATHRVVLQDDVLPCPSFRAVLERAIAARPDRLLVLCVCGRPQRSAQSVLRAGARGESWAVLDSNLWIPTIALVWPARLVGPALACVDEQGWPPNFRADDEIVGRVARALGETVLATVPSLVQHQDVVPSLVGRRAAGGRDPGRVAVCFVPEGCDPLGIDWELGSR